MVIGICAELSFFVFNDKKLNKSNYLLILLYFLATMLTSKRMLCVIILLEIGVALKLFDFKGKSVKIILGGAIALVAVFVITITIPQTSNIVDRFMEASEDTSAGGRLMFWNYCIEMFKDKPFFGFGYEGFWANYMDYQADYFSKHPDSPFVMIADNTFRPFNEYVALIVNYGIVGFTVFISIIVILYKLYNRNRRSETNIAITCLISIGVYACFSYPLSTPLYGWFIVFSIYTLFSIC